MNYEVTIGIPVYKAVDYIEKTMESALSQTFACIEYLIVDDCGNDGTTKVVERLQKEHPRGKDIRVLYNKRNLGVGKTRNIILDQAQGEYLFFLDSDDILEPDAIEKMMKAARQYQAEIVYGSWIRVDNVHHSPVEYNQYPDLQLLRPDEMAMYAFKNYSSFQISVCNILFNLNMIRQNHMRFIDTIFWEDLAFTYNLVPKVGRAVFLSDITYHYLCRPGSLSQYQDRELIQKKEIKTNVLTIDYLKDKSLSYYDKNYFPYLCYNLEMNSFYITCYVLKHSRKIEQTFSCKELRDYMRFPIGLSKILFFKKKRISCLMLWIIAHLPSSIFVIVIKGIGKVKHII